MFQDGGGLVATWSPGRDTQYDTGEVVKPLPASAFDYTSSPRMARAAMHALVGAVKAKGSGFDGTGCNDSDKRA